MRLKQIGGEGRISVVRNCYFKESCYYSFNGSYVWGGGGGYWPDQLVLFTLRKIVASCLKASSVFGYALHKRDNRFKLRTEGRKNKWKIFRWRSSFPKTKSRKVELLSWALLHCNTIVGKYIYKSIHIYLYIYVVCWAVLVEMRHLGWLAAGRVADRYRSSVVHHHYDTLERRQRHTLAQGCNIYVCVCVIRPLPLIAHMCVVILSRSSLHIKYYKCYHW